MTNTPTTTAVDMTDYNSMEIPGTDQKKVGGAACILIILNVTMAYFFGTYWLRNPDVYPPQLFGVIH
jgi:hypothetical protein